MSGTDHSATELTHPSLGTLISRAIAEHDTADPRELASLVAASASDDEVRRLFVESLVGAVRNVLGSQRNRALDNVFTPTPAVRSAKVAGIRDWWAEMCASRVHVGEARWVSLDECSAHELQFAATERRNAAQKEMQRADMYDSLRSLLRTHKVQTVAELPDDAARAAVSGVAA